MASEILIPSKNMLTDLLIQEVKAVWECEGISYGLSNEDNLLLDKLITEYEKQ